MRFFPVTHSILSTSHLAEFIQNKYTLGADVHCKLIKSGINDTYLVTAGQNRFVFRVYSLNWRNPTEIEAEINFLIQLKQADISISYPITDAQKVYLQILNAPEGLRYGVMFSYAPGNKLHEVAGEIHYEIGRTVGRIHQISKNQKIDRINYSLEVLVVESLAQISHFLAADSTEMQYLKNLQKFILDQLNGANINNMQTGIVHLDIWFDNLNIDEDGNITIFDFDFCGNGWLSLDVAYYIMQLHNLEKYEAAKYQPKIEQFLKGYESMNALSMEEKRLFPILGLSLYFFYLGTQCQRFENWSNAFLNENYLKRFVNMIIKRYADIYNIPAL
ncbi:MAG TPA: phosphotransferase [Saprospiraceae bacterium]|nr:phosphotransferase [Saprospiraceae bacterium]HPN68044.1 phosphotransferase [Saprospiraceae bacterium]